MNTSLSLRRICIYLSWLPITLLFIEASVADTNVSFTLKQPTWEFLLQNQPYGETAARLESSESNFSQRIQPLLAAQDHTGILHAFEEREIANDSAALRLLRGQVLLVLQRNKEAEQALLAALQLMPDLALAHRSLSMVYMLEKQYQNAQKHLARSIELGVADAQVYGQLAFVNLQLGQAASSVAGYQFALFMEPENNQWRQGLLYALLQSQDFAPAQALVEELLKAEPGNADLWLQRGQLALAQENPLQAISSLETALQLGENSAQNVTTIAQLHIQSGSPRRAVDLLANNAKVLIAAEKIEVLDQIAAWLAYQENWRELETLLSAVDRAKPKLHSSLSSRFSLYRANIALSKRQRDAARKRLQSSIDADPSNGEALLTLAKLLRDQNRGEQAINYYVRAEALPLYKERALLGRAQLEIDRENYSEALRLLRAVVQFNPGRSDVLANIQSLENLSRNSG